MALEDESGRRLQLGWLPRSVNRHLRGVGSESQIDLLGMPDKGGVRDEDVGWNCSTNHVCLV